MEATFLTFKDLKTFCDTNNIEFEVLPKMSEYLDYFGNTKTFVCGYEIGMRNIAMKSGKSEWNWTWFNILSCEEELKDTDNVFFEHRYSQINGKYYRGWRESRKAEDIIKRYL